MTEPKTFVADDPDLDAPPFPITVEYRRFTGPEDEEDNGKRPSERVTDTFLCRPYVNAGVLVWMDVLLSKQSNTGPAPVFDLFDAALIPADAARFRAIINSSDCHITGKLLGEIAMYLHEVYTARPTQPAAGT